MQRRIQGVQKDQTPSSANPVLLLPGLMCDQAFWQPLLASQPALTFQVVDYGDADTLSAMAEAVLAVAPLRFALAGHSMDGRVALDVARLAPSRVQKLILMDTGYLLRATDAAGDAERAGRMVLMERPEAPIATIRHFLQ